MNWLRYIFNGALFNVFMANTSTSSFFSIFYIKQLFTLSTVVCRYIESMLVQCWRRRPTLNQNWINVSCLPSVYINDAVYHVYPVSVWCWADIVISWPTSKQHFVQLSLWTRHWSSDGSMLAHRLRRWPNLDPALEQCFMLSFVDILRMYLLEANIGLQFEHWFWSLLCFITFTICICLFPDNTIH